MRDEVGRFTKGLIPWSKGKKGIHLSVLSEFKKGHIPWNKGLTRSDPRVAAYADAQRDRVKKNCEFCGKEYEVNKFRDKTTRFCSGKCRSRWLGKKYKSVNSFYRKEHNKYVYLHIWINKTFGKANKCEMCKIKNKSIYHWANKTGNYLKERSDWLELCPKCHYRYDIERGIRQFEA